MEQNPQNVRRPRSGNRTEDPVTEAGLESFPASDPPSYNTPGRQTARDQALPRSASRIVGVEDTSPDGRPQRESEWVGRSALIALVILAVVAAAWLLFG